MTKKNTGIIPHMFTHTAFLHYGIKFSFTNKDTRSFVELIQPLISLVINMERILRENYIIKNLNFLRIS